MLAVKFDIVPLHSFTPWCFQISSMMVSFSSSGSSFQEFSGKCSFRNFQKFCKLPLLHVCLFQSCPDFNVAFLIHAKPLFFKTLLNFDDVICYNVIVRYLLNTFKVFKSTDFEKKGRCSAKKEI